MPVDPQTFIQVVVNGVVFGSLIALSAIGLSLVYGILNISNFAHGDMITAGAYLALFYNVFAHPDDTLLVAALVALALVLLAVVDRFWRRRLSAVEGVTILGAGVGLFAVTSVQYMAQGRAALEIASAVQLGPLLTLAVLAAAVALGAWGVVALRKRARSAGSYGRLAVAAGLLLGAGVLAYFAARGFATTAAVNTLGFFLDELTLVALLAVVVVPVLAVALELSVWRPLRKRRATAITVIIVSIGLALVLRNALIMVPSFGGGIHLFARPVQGPLCISPDRIGDAVAGLCPGGIIVTRDKILAIVVSAALILGVHLLLSRTRIGKALRAMADNADLARVSGIDVDRMAVYVWILAGALGAVAGVLLALISNVNPLLGWYLLLPTFAAVILGGIGSAYGAMAGAMTIGLAMEFASLFGVSEYRLAVAFVILIVMLLVRPQGLFGGKL